MFTRRTVIGAPSRVEAPALRKDGRVRSAPGYDHGDPPPEARLAQAFWAAWNCGEFESIPAPRVRSPRALGSGKFGNPCERMQAEYLSVWAVCCACCAGDRAPRPRRALVGRSDNCQGRVLWALVTDRLVVVIRDEGGPALKRGTPNKPVVRHLVRARVIGRPERESEKAPLGVQPPLVDERVRPRRAAGKALGQAGASRRGRR